jgi:hypothetical protein
MSSGVSLFSGNVPQAAHHGAQQWMCFNFTRHRLCAKMDRASFLHMYLDLEFAIFPPEASSKAGTIPPFCFQTQGTEM